MKNRRFKTFSYKTRSKIRVAAANESLNVWAVRRDALTNSNASLKIAREGNMNAIFYLSQSAL